MDMDFHVKSYCQLFDELQKNVKTVFAAERADAENCASFSAGKV